ncbi:MAG: hypothetical protein KDA37_09265 [Planctomycetales bacterium]|nr:hypothetical protein [Planctomycetales bacterium]
MSSTALKLVRHVVLLAAPFGLGWFVGAYFEAAAISSEATDPRLDEHLERPSPRVAEWLHAYLVRESSLCRDRNSDYSRGLQRHIDELDSQARLVESTIVDHPNPRVLEDALEFLRARSADE